MRELRTLRLRKLITLRTSQVHVRRQLHLSSLAYSSVTPLFTRKFGFSIQKRCPSCIFEYPNSMPIKHFTTPNTPPLPPSDPHNYRLHRLEDVSQWVDQFNAHPYHSHPNFKPTHSIPQIVTQYTNQPNSSEPTAEIPNDLHVCVAGRVHSKRVNGSKLVFYDLFSEGYKIQVRANRKEWMANSVEHQGNTTSMDPFDIHRLVKRGDIISVKGIVRRTPRGELSVYATSLMPFTPCLNDIPLSILDPNVRLRQRYLDLLVHPDRLHVYATRSRIINSVRSFLVNNNFLEVETPILWPSVGGALARPFVTTSNAFGEKLPLFLRIAPELFLKELILSGHERIFELSKVFRNEGIDDSHNPEFTSCEFYWSYADLPQLITFTQDMIVHIVKSINAGSPIMQVRSFIALPNPNSTTDAEVTKQQEENSLISIDFSQPFPIIDVMKALESIVQEPLADPNEESNLPYYINLLKRHRLDDSMSPPYTIPRILDKFIGEFIEPKCIQPTFIARHPICMSPLAKSSLQLHRTAFNSSSTNPIGVCDRFELFIGGKEIVNAYSELNDPEEQRRRFAAQQRQHEDHGDEEAMVPDEHFCKALEFGLPPTSGWGMGIDRFCMLLTQTTHIRDILYFPITRPPPPSKPSAQ